MMVATSREWEFVCKTCSCTFASFHILGGHRTSHIRVCQGLEFNIRVYSTIRKKKKGEDK
jgi:hypothetical protein